MKKILGLDLGTNSIGWALVNEAEDNNERSSIIKLGSRIIHYDNFVSTETGKASMEPEKDFKGGKGISPNAGRTKYRSARRNLQRYKLRRQNLVEILKDYGIISEETILSENGNKTTFETYRLRAKAAFERISMEEFGRILLMINKKRGYKSSRKAKNQEEGQLIDGMSVAKILYDQDITPGEFVLNLLKQGKKSTPDFYRSDLRTEFDKVWTNQKQFYPELLTDEFRNEIEGKGQRVTSAIFWNKYGFNTAENKGTREEKKLQAYEWRYKALRTQLTKEEVAFVLAEINNNLHNSSGYLGSISDRSKELFFNKKTVGQYLMEQLDQNPNSSLKNQVFYRQDYLDEFNTLWDKQATYHNELTPELKAEIRDIVIFFQRRLKSQKGLISFCEFESRQIEVDIDGKKKKKTVGSKVCPKSSPIFQEFKIWQILNNVEVSDKKTRAKRLLSQEEKEQLFEELSLKSKLSKAEAIMLLFSKSKDLDLNYKEIEGNRTQAALYDAYRKIIEFSGHGELDFAKMEASRIIETVKNIFHGLNYNTEILSFDSGLEGEDFDKQPLYQLWHLLYSFEDDNSKTGDEKLINKISELYGFEKEFATILANVSFQQDYGSLSTKAIRKILPYLKDGFSYGGRKDLPQEPSACEYAGYRHSKNSLTKEEIDNKVFKDQLDILPKNSLRNPVVEKILNQMINVVNTVTEIHGKPDEIRIELARELKKSAKEREDLTSLISKTTTEHEKYKDILQKEFGISHVSRNDIIRFKLYLELEYRGFKTLYSETYIQREKLFSKEFDIEHIIPQSRLFDDSFSNKTLESRSINIEKGNETACDYVLAKQGEIALADYLNRIEELYKASKISKTKYNKLRMKGTEIPDNFIARDLRDTQYIAKIAKSILEGFVRDVVSTTGSITNRLREDWQLIDVMQELNWEKYNALGMTEIIENREGHKIRRIKDWTKRNDHRHHAMDALTIAFTKRNYIQYLNNLNARSDKSGSIYGIETKELYRDDKGNLKFKPPIPLCDFRAEAKKHLESTLISVKAKNKVTTININTTDKTNGTNKKRQLTPRGQLHLETVYGSIQKYVTKEEKVGAGFNEEQIAKVSRLKYRNALLNRLKEFDKDPKKAFTGKNSLEKNPIFLDELQTQRVPEKVKTVSTETVYTIRKDITADLKLDKVIDVKIKAILQDRLNEFNGDNKRAFSNLADNPIWLNKAKGISIKRVTISGISNAQALHSKRDKNGRLILDSEGKTQAVDFVNTGNNHHVAIYRDEKGNLQENVISFFEATTRVNQGYPIVDKEYKKTEGWEFLFSMKQNEYFVFPNELTGFDPREIDLIDPASYSLISPNLFRVQKFSKVIYGNSAVRDYVFRHHLETTVNDNNELRNIAFKSIKSLPIFNNIFKVRLNHIGQIVSVGEF